jgi:hypothetical protein
MTSLGAVLTGFFVFPRDWSISRSPRIPQPWISATNVILGIRQRTRDAGTRATARPLATVFTLLHNQEQDCAPGPRSGSTPDTDLGPPDPALGPPRTQTWVHLRPGVGRGVRSRAGRVVRSQTGRGVRSRAGRGLRSRVGRGLRSRVGRGVRSRVGRALRSQVCGLGLRPRGGPGGAPLSGPSVRYPGLWARRRGVWVVASCSSDRLGPASRNRERVQPYARLLRAPWDPDASAWPEARGHSGGNQGQHAG